MRISFDLDETLVCRASGGPRERSLLPWFLTALVGEPLRQGTRSLFTELRRRGFSIWIYTTSLRPPFQIKRWLMLHGLRVDGVVNHTRHFAELSHHTLPRLPSKYPPAFGIDLHVDDSEGVRMEGEELGFRVIVVHPEDGQWVSRVLDAAEQVTRAIESAANAVRSPSAQPT